MVEIDKENSEFIPNKREVNKVLDYLIETFPVEKQIIIDNIVYFTIVDDRLIRLKGFLSNKDYAKKKIFLSIKDELNIYKEASIKKAIKIFIDNSDKIYSDK
jgi:hypothetical protein